MSKYVIEQRIKRKSIENPLRSYMWEVQLPTLSVNLPIREKSFIDSRLPNLGDLDVQEISQRITNVSVPFRIMETESAQSRNTYWKFATKSDIGPLSFDIIEHEDGKTLQYLTGWQNLIMNDNGTYNPPVAYKKDIIVARLGAHGAPVIFHLYKGFFISNISELTTDYETSDFVRYQVTLTGDDVLHASIPWSDVESASEEKSMIDKVRDIQRRISTATKQIAAGDFRLPSVLNSVSQFATDGFRTNTGSGNGSANRSF